MSKILTTEEFIEKARKKHNNNYDYLLVEYVNADIKIKIICHEHGIFIQRPANHLFGQKCPHCSELSRRNKRRSNNEEFIKKANNKHNYKYDYSSINYIDSYSKIIIICSKHGAFEQIPSDHLMGAGCPKCGKINQINKRKLSTEEFIKRAKIVHEDKYDYSDTVYISGRKKVGIICQKHGIFFQKPHDHLYGSGCRKCVGLNTKTSDEFIEESKKIFGNKFEYSNVNYINSKTNLLITCKKHGEFKVNPCNHLSKKQGCPVCKESKGEQKISDVLNKMNILFIRQKTFDDCKGKKRKLPFDFYLLDYIACVEYDGRQHFEIVNAFGGELEFSDIQRNDKIKNEFLKNNNINLLRISYCQYNNIENILKEKILEWKS